VDFKKNGFWIGLAAGVGVAVIGFVALVLPKWAEESDKRTAVTGAYGTQLTAIQAGGDEVPTEQWVSQAGTQDAAILAESKKLYQFFNAGDLALEAWFEGKVPTKGVMMSKASDGIANMLKELAAKMDTKDAKNVPVFGRHLTGATDLQGFEFARSEDVPEGDMEAMKRWMRNYNIHTKMKDAMLEANAKRFYKVQFSTIQYPPEMGARLKERPISNDLGMYIPFLLDCSLLWKDIPTLLAAIVRYDEKTPGPMFRIAMMRMERDPNFAIVGEVKEDVEEEEYNEATWKPTFEAVEDPVRVYLLIEAHNFNIPEARLK